MDDSDEDIFETYAQKTPEKSYTEKSSKYSSSPNKYSSEKKETPTKSPKSNSSKDKPLCKYGASCFRTNPEHLAKYYHPKSDSPSHKNKPNKDKDKDKDKGKDKDNNNSKWWATSPPKDQKEVKQASTESSTSSPSGQKWWETVKPCKLYLQGCCRYSNIKHLGKCKYAHPSNVPLPTQNATYNLHNLNPNGATYRDIQRKFEATCPNARVVKVEQVDNQVLATLYKQRRTEIYNLRGQKNFEQTLYHGTAEKNIHVICTRGFVPPADYEANPQCKTSGHLKPGSASLCDNTCTLCTNQHKWNQCHMYGLGVYFADLAQKSHRYVHDINGNAPKSGSQCKMFLCNVELGNTEFVKTNLSSPSERHDNILPKKGYDSVDIQGSSSAATGLGVINNEYVIFHPFQAIPAFIITYIAP